MQNNNELRDLCYKMSLGDDSLETFKKYCELTNQIMTDEEMLKRWEEFKDENEN